MEYNHDYFSGKTAVVTGAASGIGLALIEELLLSNASKVVMADINTDNLNRHQSRLKEQYGDRIKGIVCNVTSEEQVRSMIDRSAEFFDGHFDLLINNAGSWFGGGFKDLTDEDWKAAFDLNFYSALYGIRAVLPMMLKQGGGQIINIISGIAFSPMPYQARYSATKAALNALTLSLRSEYWDANIKLSSATPGTTATPIWGDQATPATAQTPQQSASRMMNGIANNDRIIYGDDMDVTGGSYGANPQCQQETDQYFIRVARERSKGIMAI